MSVTAIDGHPFAPFEQTNVTFPLSDVRLLPPVLPNKVIGIGKNYADHAREMGDEPPSTPVMFLKPSTTVVGPDESVVLPPQSAQVEFEGEIALVVGRLARHVPPERVADVTLGYTCADDVTARDLQRSDGQWTRAKLRWVLSAGAVDRDRGRSERPCGDDGRERRDTAVARRRQTWFTR